MIISLWRNYTVNYTSTINTDTKCAAGPKKSCVRSLGCDFSIEIFIVFVSIFLKISAARRLSALPAAALSHSSALPQRTRAYGTPPQFRFFSKPFGFFGLATPPHPPIPPRQRRSQLLNKTSTLWLSVSVTEYRVLIKYWMLL